MACRGGHREHETALLARKYSGFEIIEAQTDEFWQDITIAMLEDVRKRLRSLVKFIEKTKRPTIYTDFVDRIGEDQEVELPGFGGHDIERFRDKAQQFLKAHENDP